MWIFQKCWLQPIPTTNRKVIYLLWLLFLNQKYTWSWPNSTWLSNIFIRRTFNCFYIHWFVKSRQVLPELLYFFTLNGLLHLPKVKEWALILENIVPLRRWHAAHHVLAHCALQLVDRYSVKRNWVAYTRLKHLSHLLAILASCLLHPWYQCSLASLEKQTGFWKVFWILPSGVLVLH